LRTTELRSEMNLREVQLSSRSVIPVALALPINRDPAIHVHEARERERRNERVEQWSAKTEAAFLF
jgi:hypothetical protein